MATALARALCARTTSLLVAAALLAACRAPGPAGETPRALHHDCGTTVAADGRGGLIYATDRAVVHRRGDGRREVPYAACGGCLGGRVARLVPLSDGNRVFVWGSEPNMEGDIWGHAGRHVTVSCVVDLDAGSCQPAPEWLASRIGRDLFVFAGKSGLLYRWHEGVSPLEVFDPATGRSAQVPLPDRARVCRVIEVGAEARIGCLGPDSLVTRRVDESSWPPRIRDEISVPLPGGFYQPSNAVFSSDGRRLAIFGVTSVKSEVAPVRYGVRLAIADLEERRLVWDEQEERPVPIAAVGLSPSGDAILVADATIDERPDSPAPRVRLIDLRGGSSRLVADPPFAVDQLVWSAGSDTFWAVGSCDARQYPIPR